MVISPNGHMVEGVATGVVPSDATTSHLLIGRVDHRNPNPYLTILRKLPDFAQYERELT
jgi:hypothetical protein